MPFCSKQYAAYGASCLSFYMLAVSIQVAVLRSRPLEVLPREGGSIALRKVKRHCRFVAGKLTFARAIT